MPLSAQDADKCVISWYRLPPRMGAAAFYDLDGTLVRTNLVHAFAFSARNQQGILQERRSRRPRP